MAKLMVGLLVLCLGLDLALGMTLFREERQNRGGGRNGGGRNGGGRNGGGRGGGRGRGRRPPTLEQLTGKIQKEIEEYNAECDGVTFGSCDEIASNIDSILGMAYSGTADEAQMGADLLAILRNAPGATWDDVQCTIHNCFTDQLYLNFQAGKRLSFCGPEEEVEELEEVEEEQERGEEEDDAKELCLVEAVIETCDVSENAGVYSVDAEQCAQALGQKIYDEMNAVTSQTEAQKRTLTNRLVNLMRRQSNGGGRRGRGRGKGRGGKGGKPEGDTGGEMGGDMEGGSGGGPPEGDEMGGEMGGEEAGPPTDAQRRNFAKRMLAKLGL